MTVININVVPNTGSVLSLVDFKGVDDVAALRLREIVSDHPGVFTSDALQQVLHEAGIEPAFFEGLTQWFYAHDDPCACWRQVNVNDLRYTETFNYFNALAGIEPSAAEAVSVLRASKRRPKGALELVNLLTEAGVPMAVIERLSTWMTAEINEITNAPNELETLDSLSDHPVLMAAEPSKAAPGDKLRLDVINLRDEQSTWVEINGYPARLNRFDTADGILECIVPEEACDAGEIRVFVDGMPSPISLEIPLLPKLIENPCHDAEFADTRLDVRGTSSSVLIDVDRTDPVTGEAIHETLQTEFYCGTNGAILRGAHAPFPVTYVIGDVLDHSYYGLFGSPLLAAALTVVQFIGREEEDAAGKKRIVYYFFRDGKWWRVRDKTRMHPKDSSAVDVRDDVTDKNFDEADAAIAAELQKSFFPSGWEQAWQEFEESQRVQMQLMWAITWQMAGGDADSAKLLFDVKKSLDDGETVDEILAKHWKKILFSVVLGVAVGNAGKILRVMKRFFRFFFPKLINRISRVVKNGDDITIDIIDEAKHGQTSGKLGKKVGGNGIDAGMRGRIDRGRNVLYAQPTVIGRHGPIDTGWVNETGRRGFARDIFQDWVEKLKTFAKEKKVRNVEIDMTTITKEGAEMAEKLGFLKVSEHGSGKLKSIKWTRIYPVD